MSGYYQGTVTSQFNYHGICDMWIHTNPKAHLISFSFERLHGVWKKLSRLVVTNWWSARKCQWSIWNLYVPNSFFKESLQGNKCKFNANGYFEKQKNYLFQYSLLNSLYLIIPFQSNDLRNPSLININNFLKAPHCKSQLVQILWLPGLSVELCLIRIILKEGLSHIQGLLNIKLRVWHMQMHYCHLAGIQCQQVGSMFLSSLIKSRPGNVPTIFDLLDFAVDDPVQAFFC